MKKEYTKRVVGLVMFTYFVGLFIGSYVVFKILMDYPEYAVQALIAMFTYIGTPTATTIGFYCWKAKNENIKKIGGNVDGINDNI
jgi:uncharacterized protein YneF (UPF0154 family)